MTARSLLAAAAVLVPLMGCETRETQRSATTEVLLAGAGFEIKKADTPQRQEQLQALAQRRIVRHESDGRTVYIYADARGCACLYQGSEANYQRYREFAGSSRAPDTEPLEALEAEPGTDPDWAIW